MPLNQHSITTILKTPKHLNRILKQGIINEGNQNNTHV